MRCCAPLPPHRSSGDVDCDRCARWRGCDDRDEPNKEEREQLLQADDDANEAQTDAHRFGSNGRPVPLRVERMQLLRDNRRKVGKPCMLFWNLSIGPERPVLSHELVQPAAMRDVSTALGSACSKQAAHT